MKVRIELDPSMDEPEILIRAPRLTPELTQLQERILEQKVAQTKLILQTGYRYWIFQVTDSDSERLYL